MASQEHHHHIISVKTYAKVFVTLLFLTVVTVAAAQVDLGATLNLIIALAIAFVKASLVLMVFMGLRWERGVSNMAFVVSFLCLMIFILLTFADLMTRKAMDPMEATQFGLETPVNLIQPGEDAHGHDAHH